MTFLQLQSKLFRCSWVGMNLFFPDRLYLAWMKKDGLFDVTMGAYDGAEVCELVGTFLLDKISEKYEKNSIGLYRDDRLSVFQNKSSTQLERIKKNLQKHSRTLV